MRPRLWIAIVLVASCNDAAVEDESSSTSAVTESEQSSTTSAAAPASAAGESSASGPGLPADVAGPVRDSIALTAEELEAIKQANQLHAKRRPPKQDPRDFGFVVHPR